LGLGSKALCLFERGFEKCRDFGRRLFLCFRVAPDCDALSQATLRLSDGGGTGGCLVVSDHCELAAIEIIRAVAFPRAGRKRH